MPTSFFKRKKQSLPTPTRDILAELEQERAVIVGAPSTTSTAAKKTQQAYMSLLQAERDIAGMGGRARYGGGGQLIFELGMIGIAAAFAVVKAKPTDNGRWHRNRGRTAWG
jgi:flavorubredoxin